MYIEIDMFLKLKLTIYSFVDDQVSQDHPASSLAMVDTDFRF
jgi:hypothetical protein